jgi:hypothetical protein
MFEHACDNFTNYTTNFFLPGYTFEISKKYFVDPTTRTKKYQKDWQKIYENKERIF